MTEYISPDAHKVTRDEALEFMAHHLCLAAMYFEQVEDTPESRIELARLLMRNDPRSQPPQTIAGLAFYDTIFQVYELMKADD